MASKTDKDTPAAQDPLKEDPSVIVDKAEFPEPSLYFKVFESEEDEPDSKIRSDVNKLYERWIEKYGRRWPEDGINTEDLVWLAEEAKKPKRGPPAPRGTPVEKSEYTDEFMPFSDDGESPAAPADGASGTSRRKSSTAAAAVGDSGGAKPAAAAASGAPRKPRTNYEKTVAGGKWVTDEFESADYEAGNLEKLWNMYLWDREGKPTMMPDGPPAQQEGEESEDWDDFYTAYRPRDIDTEEAREAVWATDEFESDEDNTESEWAPEYVGAGLGLKAEDPLNPQYSLRHSNHPLAPFPGEPLKWASYVYPDFTTYEGLTKQSIPHGMGVMTFGTGTGAGLPMNLTRYGDKYEGEFQAGYAHGLGQFTSEPYFYLLERGIEPVEAYRRTAESIMRDVEVRTWYRGTKLGDAKEDEVVEINVLRDELDHPFDIAARNSLHDAKLRRWKEMTPREKALDRLVAIIDRVQSRNPGRFGSYYYEDDKGRIKAALGEFGTDTDYDSMDMLQGVDTDGDLGLGWNDATDSSETPLEPRTRELMIQESRDDKLEDEAFKDSVLGNAIINPFTGLDLKTYLDGKERHHNDLVATYRNSREGRRFMRKARQEAGLPDDDLSSYVEEVPPSPGVMNPWGGEESEDERLARLYDKAGVSKGQVQRAETLLQRWQQLLAEDEDILSSAGPYRRPETNPLAPDDTDTGFETDSDMMEMCDIPEILGTVQEARQIVERARMWRFKPYGEVTIRMAQDANGSPVNLMQDPLHYPHGTKFMAPGPLGLVHPVPEDPALRAEMSKVAHNYAAVYRMYNFDWDPEPGTVQYKIDQRIRRAQELRDNALARYLEAADQVLDGAGEEEEAAAQGEGDQQLLVAATAAAAHGPHGTSTTRGGAPVRGSSIFASMSIAGPTLGSVRLGHAARVVLGAFAQAAKQAVVILGDRVVVIVVESRKPFGIFLKDSCSQCFYCCLGTVCALLLVGSWWGVAAVGLDAHLDEIKCV
ncbi:hypothetical protein VOLCADRAFT_104196 [Volvox carteri f. nagariensis]|uniref:Uncharacterized protein n=1 Tax=Volvox carteri f. nagariensis TaxID=3068 RepID=D8TS26_VOLCA|nr:uncharacterized protein VOLCADRAFT_104196 [Volvox carteri f. nagariensis]EFJ49752.1 hypothetical protein VOLCADRAFT_104196 [Volvox carteri f. nagariensis]|eukprot:XP_002949259.1 hypothetical protein VOLCADRAFT_104196 [Volvox carteri f. nagariensis]